MPLATRPSTATACIADLLWPCFAGAFDDFVTATLQPLEAELMDVLATRWRHLLCPLDALNAKVDEMRAELLSVCLPRVDGVQQRWCDAVSAALSRDGGDGFELQRLPRLVGALREWSAQRAPAMAAGFTALLTETIDQLVDPLWRFIQFQFEFTPGESLVA